MAEENTPATPPAGGTDPIDPPAQAATTTTPEPPAGDGTETISLEEARKLRSESANLRKRLKAFEDAENKAREAQMSEQERLQKQLTDLQKSHEEYTQATFERLTNAEIRAQAASLGINPKHLDKVARFLDWEEIEPDEQGNPTGIKEAIEKLLADMPELRTGQRSAPTAPTGGSATNPSKSHVDNSEISDAYVQDVLAGRIRWQDLTPERRTAINNYRAKNPYRF